MNAQTIIMLSAHRCGSTAMFKVFQKHPQVKIINKQQRIENWETNYWYWATFALKGKRRDYDRKLSEAGIAIPKKMNKNIVFDVWDNILNIFGPIIFDKSPIYLQSREATGLMGEYIRVRKSPHKFFAFIRDPRDAIASQHAKWPGSNLKWWAKRWLEKYEHLEELQKQYGFKIYRYEDVASNPSLYIKEILEACGLKYKKDFHSHFKPTNVGRYKCENDAYYQSNKFKRHLKKYGYGE
ncbi:MAG: hypothetical protein B7C24_06860 [Bacteroidetes bacterium 4572_77]|nr:MAG: hypothetical protein B7C24_06860 [Bacteroidetes bacterium 4572_77]